MKLSEIARLGKAIEDEIGLDIDDALNKLTQEVGKFNDAVQKFRGRYCRKREPLEKVKEEVGDVLYNIISICYRLGIDPDELLKYAENTLKRFNERKEDYKKATGKR